MLNAVNLFTWSLGAIEVKVTLYMFLSANGKKCGC